MPKFNVSLTSHLNLDKTVFVCGSPFMGENTASFNSDLYANCIFEHNNNNIGMGEFVYSNQ
jgi:hypothetical protein